MLTHHSVKSTAKRATVISIVILLGMVQAMLFLPFLWLRGIAAAGMLMVSWYLYHASKSRSQEVWHQQLSAVIQRMSAPVLLFDNNLQITYANDSFWRLSFSIMLNQKKNIAEFLASYSSANLDKVQEVERFTTLLKGLSGKIKIPMQCSGNKFDWIITPLFSPRQQRWSTLVECVAKTPEGGQTQGLPLSQMLEQMATPFFFVDPQNQIVFVNNTLKMELKQSQKVLQAFDRQMIFDVEAMTLKQFLLLIKKEELSFAELIKAGNLAIKLGEDEFKLVFQPLWSAENKNLGTLVLWQRSIIRVISPPGASLIESGITQAANPMVILNSRYQIEYHSTAFVKMFATLKIENCQAKNLLAIFQEVAKPTAISLKRALESGKCMTFLAQHAEVFYDWTVNPIKNDKKIVGYIVEAITPAIQEVKALEESRQRLQHKKFNLEKELTKFTRSLAELKLYQKGTQLSLEHLKVENYQHPLLKNSTKHLQHIAENLANTFNEVERLNTLMIKQSAHRATMAPVLPQVEVLSSSIVRNVQEAQQEFAYLGQELSKFTGLVQEQQGLNEALVKPVGLAIQLSEQGIKQCITQAEAVTIVVQQLHENQKILTHIQEFMVKVEEFGAKVTAEQLAQMHHHAIKLVDKARQTALTGKSRLSGLLPQVDQLKSSWHKTLENLKFCLQLVITIEQATKRGQNINELSRERSQQLSSRIDRLLELTEKFQYKMNGIDSKQHELRASLFDQIAFEVDEAKKKAEEVLLEGFNRQ